MDKRNLLLQLQLLELLLEKVAVKCGGPHASSTQAHGVRLGLRRAVAGFDVDGSGVLEPPELAYLRKQVPNLLLGLRENLVAIPVLLLPPKQRLLPGVLGTDQSNEERRETQTRLGVLKLLHLKFFRTNSLDGAGYPEVLFFNGLSLALLLAFGGILSFGELDIETGSSTMDAEIDHDRFASMPSQGHVLRQPAFLAMLLCELLLVMPLEALCCFVALASNKVVALTKLCDAAGKQGHGNGATSVWM